MPVSLHCCTVRKVIRQKLTVCIVSKEQLNELLPLDSEVGYTLLFHKTSVVVKCDGAEVVGQKTISIWRHCPLNLYKTINTLPV